MIYATGYVDGFPDAASVHGPILRKPYRPAELARNIERVMSDSSVG